MRPQSLAFEGGGGGGGLGGGSGGGGGDGGAIWLRVTILLSMSKVFVHLGSKFIY